MLFIMPNFTPPPITSSYTPSHVLLKIAVHSEDQTLIGKYQDAISVHNRKMLLKCPDSGFDIFVPEDFTFNSCFDTHMIDMKVSFEMHPYSTTSNTYDECCGFCSYPRSSISKTPLMLANHVGIIDSGYRGTLRGAFRMLPTTTNADNKSYIVEKHQRLLQICHPSLCPIYVQLAAVGELSSSARGTGGFGSTGV
jgi:dUTPase